MYSILGRSLLTTSFGKLSFEFEDALLARSIGNVVSRKHGLEMLCYISSKGLSSILGG